MTPERHQRLLELFAKVYDLPPDTWSSTLDRECADEPDLRRDVETLLERSGDTDSFLDTPALGRAIAMPEETTADPDAAYVGAEIGQFRLTRLVARGGMGAVYEAEQRHPARRVALKLMRADLFSRTALRRFEYEAQILSRLRHPGVAQIHEAGVWADHGLPYFAMEYIEDARPVTTYVEQEKLSVRKRVELFIEIGGAVSHGHQKGVIHRDLKPDNILIDSSGRPKIIDFGVAVMTDADIALTTMQTGVRDLIGTLTYMSPEQYAANPHDLDVRTDVYSLGVVLYEALCGRPPIEIGDAPAPRALQMLMTGQPDRPSAISEACTGDLEAIVLKAIERDRDRRYASVADLAEDLRRYLAHEPVSARPPTATYQLRMFTRRHRAPVTAGVVVAVALVFTLVATLWQMGRTNDALKEAESKAAYAESVNEVMHGILTDADLTREMTLLDILDRASQSIEQTTAGQPLVEAEVRNMLRGMYFELGQYDLAEPHARRAVEIFEEQHGRGHPDTLSAISDLGWVRMRQGGHGENEALAESENLLRQAYEGRRRLFGEHDGTTLVAQSGLAMALWSQNRFEEAEDILRENLELKKRLFGEDAHDTLITQNNLALVLGNQHKYDQAIEMLRDLLEIYERHARPDPSERLSPLHNLASFLAECGRFNEAVPYMREAALGSVEALGPVHPLTNRRFEMLTWYLECDGQYEEAIKHYEDLLAMQREHLGTDDVAYATNLHHYADALAHLKRWSEAEKYADESLQIYYRQSHAPANEIRHGVEVLHEIMERSATRNDRIDMLRTALAYQRSNVPAGDVELITILHLLGAELLEAGVAGEAEQILAEALALAETHWPSASHEVDSSTEIIRSRLGEAMVALERFDQAEPLLLTACDRLRESLGDDDERTRDVVQRVIDLYGELGDADAVARYEAVASEAERNEEPSVAKPDP